ncbi:MAG: GNAT family N-acetyltransferase [Gracilibacteraceae bacterium]|nr:GNAT family N-acetyltransferase [Gracilibacteraceae bacterium]
MIEYRKLTHEDYDDIADICKDIWDGTDYLPEVFHKWVDDKGLFLGAVDTDTNKVVGTDKYSLLYDGTGWLEGLRIHKDYRGLGIGKKIAIRTFKKALEDLRSGKTNKIAFATHISSVESINLMKKFGFRLRQEYKFIYKDYSDADNSLSIEDFDVESWKPSYEEFANLSYLKRRDGILPFVFYFQKPTFELYEELLKENSFVSINGYKGLFKLRGEPHFIVFDENLEGINDFMNYYLLALGGKFPAPPMTSVMPKDKELIRALNAAGFGMMDLSTCDYLYYTYEE